MGIADGLKAIGRSKPGARALDAARAEGLMRQIFDGRANDLQLGAFAITALAHAFLHARAQAA